MKVIPTVATLKALLRLSKDIGIYSYIMIEESQ